MAVVGAEDTREGVALTLKVADVARQSVMGKNKVGKGNMINEWQILRLLGVDR